MERTPSTTATSSSPQDKTIVRIDESHVTPSRQATPTQDDVGTTSETSNQSEVDKVANVISEHPPCPPSRGPLNPTKIWQQTVARLDGMAADCASNFVDAKMAGNNNANSAPNRLVVTFLGSYTSSKSFCETPERHSEMEKIVSELAGQKVKLEFAVRADTAHATPAKPSISTRQRERELAQRPFVQRAMELFSGEISGVSSPKPNP